MCNKKLKKDSEQKCAIKKLEKDSDLNCANKQKTEKDSELCKQKLRWAWIEHATFRSSVWRSPNWAIPALIYVVNQLVLIL
jgi:hypothetical protein